VPQPQGDDGAIDTGLEELPGRAVPENVRRDTLLLQGGQLLAGDRHAFADEILDGIGAEAAAVDAWEKGLGTAPARFPQPLFQHGDCGGGQRRAPFLASFAEATDMRAPPQDDGVPVETDQLRNAQSGLDAKQEQGVISPSDPCRPVGHGKEGLDLGPCQKMNLLLAVALGWYR